MEISVIIPWYGGISNLEVTINSIRNCDLYFTDVIVVDDNNEKMVVPEKILRECTLLRNATNIGAAKSRNYGAVRAKGDFLLFMDAGDELLSGINALRDLREVDVVYGKHVLISEKNSRIVNRWHSDYREFVLARVPSTTSGLIVRKALFNLIGGFENVPRSQEATLWLKICDETDVNISFIDDVIVRRNVSSNRESISTATDALDATWLKIRLNYVRNLKELIGVFLCFIDVVARRMIRSSPLTSILLLSMLVVVSPFSRILFSKIWIK